MAQCRWCGRSGPHLSITEQGVCRACYPIVGMDIVQRTRIIEESNAIVYKSKKLETRISRCELIIEHAKALLPYEVRGIPTISPVPSKAIEAFGKIRDDIVVDTLQNEFVEILKKTSLPMSPKTKVNRLAKFLLRVRENKSKVASKDLLNTLETKVSEEIHSTQLNSMLESARKCEFKRQQKKALNHYYDALYFLRHDDIDDKLQSTQISAVEEKIKELGGTLN